MQSAVREYFDGQAAGYATATASWRWAWLRAREKAALARCAPDFRGAEVLDLGSGAGFYSEFALERGARSVCAVDISPRMLEKIRDPRIQPLLADCAHVNPGRKFSCIVAAGVLEFTDDPVRVLRNARAHAEDRASLLLLVPHRSLTSLAYSLFHRRNGMRIRRFSRAHVERLAASTGWRINRSSNAWPFAGVYHLEATA